MRRWCLQGNATYHKEAMEITHRLTSRTSAKATPDYFNAPRSCTPRRSTSPQWHAARAGLFWDILCDEKWRNVSTMGG
jgi:hypothetical protein